MKIFGRMIFCAAIVLEVAISLSGCSTVVHGGSASAPMVTASTSASVSPSDTSDFGALRACDVLTKVLQGQGFGPAGANTYGGRNGCSADKATFGSVILGLQDDAVFDQLNSNSKDVRKGDVNGRPAVQIRDGLRANGDCDVSMKVGAKSRALVFASLSTGSTDETCEFVNSVAEKVEPMLPRIN